MKKFATFFYISFLFLSLPLLKTNAQTPEIVVNEYYNQATYSQEWSELVVIRNFTNLQGYVFTDNNASQASWQGGVIFKNIPLWTNVQEGTIIVIWHRDLPTGTTRDINIADGYIEVSRNDREIFEEFLQSGGEYDDIALNIAADGDILQVRSSNGNSISSHVHALGHKTTPGGSYNALVNAGKPILNTFESCSDGSSNAVIPGRRIEDYNGTGKSQIVSGSNITRGLPNRNSASLSSENYKFWEELREPEWLAANSLKYTYSSTGIRLDWTSFGPSSSSDGYVILRAKSFPTLPVFDGYILQRGEPFPSFPDITVVDILSSAAITYTENFTSTFQLPCGEFFEYRVYPFRYGKDDQNKDINPLHARGRSYNENQYGRITVSRPAFPTPPVLTTLSGNSQFVFCEGGSLTLAASPADANSYQWFRDGQQITGSTGNTLLVLSEGRYAVRAFNAEGCAEQSQEVTVTKSTSPQATIVPAGPIRLCDSDDTTLVASPQITGYSYQWIAGDGSFIPGAMNPLFNTDKPGIYRVIITNDAGCSDTSDAVIIRGFTPDLAFKNENSVSIITIEFPELGECETSAEETLVISTLSTEAFAVELEAPPGFSVIPSVFLLESQSPQVVKVTFSPTEAKIYNDDLRIKAPCGLTTRFPLKGTKSSINVAAIQSTVEFPTALSCEAQKQVESVLIVNRGTGPVEFTSPTVAAPFNVISPTFPKTVAQGDTLIISVEYSPINGTTSRTLTVPYKSLSCESSVNVTLSSKTIRPSLTTTATEIDFKTLEGCLSFKDTTFSLTNASDVQLTVPAQVLSPNFSIAQTFTLLPRETRQIALRFAPVSSGSISSTVVLKASECPEEANITLVLKGLSGAPSLQSVPVFETITNCTESSRILKSGITTISPVVISNIIVPTGFSVNGITPGQTITGSRTFDIVFTPAADGSYRDSIMIQFAGCPVAQTVIVEGRRTTLAFEFEDNVIDYGTVLPNSPPAPLTAKIRNSGTDSVMVSKIDPPPPFVFISSSRPFPATLAPGEEISLIFSYAPTSESRDSAVVQFIACFGEKTLLLKGNAQYPAGTGTAIVTLPALRAAPGDVIEVPLTIVNQVNTLALEKAAVTFITMTLQYDPMLLLPQNVRVGSAAQGFDIATITESEPGVATIVLR
ncbi:MAG TPA: hypothetical protein VEC36_02080, partial [Patescibacteria group bacterium]|nr:hypothetical protein [Patescibacteria group bacterium]